MNIPWKRLLAVAFVIGAIGLVMPVVAQAIDSCIGGKLYYIAYPDTVTNAQDPRHSSDGSEEFLLYLYSEVDQEVSIGYTGGATVQATLKGGEALEFNTREVAVPQINIPNLPRANVMKIEATFPVVVYAYVVTNFGCAAFTPIPVEAWGMEYYAAAWRGERVIDIEVGRSAYGAEYPFVKVPAPAQTLIIAAYDRTTVTISPAGQLIAQTDPVIITLDAGEAYLVQSYVDTSESMPQPDIAGSRIVADKPIGVVAGNTRLLQEPLSLEDGALANNSFKDLAVEWITPIEQHGTEFVFLPTWDEIHQIVSDGPGSFARSKEYVRVYGTTQSSTKVTYAESDQNPDVPASTSIVNAGEYSHEVLSNLRDGRLYRTTEPGQAYQSPSPMSRFAGTTGGGNYVGANFEVWGSFMVEMVPRERWGTFAPFKAPSYPAEMKHYVNVMTDTNNQFNVFYREGKSAAEPFPFTMGRIPGTDLVWGVLTVTPGETFIVQSKKGARFSGFVYGSLSGHELYIPHAQGLTDYDEKIAMMYGFPLVASRCPIPTSTSHIEELNRSEKNSGIEGLRLTSLQSVVDLRFKLTEGGRVRVALYNCLGEEVAMVVDGDRSAGNHHLNWDAKGIAAGVYYVQISVNGWTESHNLVLMR